MVIVQYGSSLVLCLSVDIDPYATLCRLSLTLPRATPHRCALRRRHRHVERPPAGSLIPCPSHGGSRSWRGLMILYKRFTTAYLTNKKTAIEGTIEINIFTVNDNFYFLSFCVCSADCSMFKLSFYKPQVLLKPYTYTCPYAAYPPSIAILSPFWSTMSALSSWKLIYQQS